MYSMHVQQIVLLLQRSFNNEKFLDQLIGTPYQIAIYRNSLSDSNISLSDNFGKTVPCLSSPSYSITLWEVTQSAAQRRLGVGRELVDFVLKSGTHTQLK